MFDLGVLRGGSHDDVSSECRESLIPLDKVLQLTRAQVFTQRNGQPYKHE